MKSLSIHTWLAVVIFLFCAPALADDTNDPFQEVVAKYRAANPKPRLPEEARKFKVQAEFAVQKKLFDQALELYGKALEIAPWWPEGHYNRALILGEMNKYRDGMSEMKRYLLLVPNAPDARAAQDKIYQWEVVAEPDLTKLAVFQDCPECPVMVALPVGSFDMGSNNGEADEKPVHRVTIGKAFAIGKTEVTRDQFAAFVIEMGYNAGDKCKTLEGDKFEERSGRSWRNPGYRQDESHPVVCINWNDAKAYVEWLSRKTGKQYRLPSEAEWEYAARAGTTTSRYWGEDNPDQDCAYANISDATFKVQMPKWTTLKCTDGYAYTAPVGSFKPNAFGLYDMLGNVTNWVEDSYHDSYAGAPTDGSVWQGDGAKRVQRGFPWIAATKARSATRGRSEPTNRIIYIGFRVARMLP